METDAPTNDRKKNKDLKPVALGRVGQGLEQELLAMTKGCTSCKKCLKDCAFLRTYGTPLEIALRFDPDNPENLAMPFACHLCGLCSAQCKFGATPAKMFLEMRREAVRRWGGPLPQHKRILGYEARGASPRFSLCALPEACDTVFFPGCTLPGAKPLLFNSLHQWLESHIPSLGVVLDCCAKPSHDLGLEQIFSPRFQALREMLLEQGVRRVLTACPNCYKVFSQYGSPLEVRMVYELLRDKWKPEKQVDGTVCVHDPCPLRERPSTPEAVRELITTMGLELQSMPHQGEKTVCCGEGGSVSHMMPEFAENWTMLREQEAMGRPVIAYCAGCTLFLKRRMEAHHILDLLFFPEKTMAGKERTSRAPFTYLNRLRIKAALKKRPKFSRFPVKKNANDQET